MFTLIIPYHNRASYLPRLLDSIERCTICPTQIILVDNASTDDSAACCQSFAQRHPELPIVLVSESRRGASFARNAGLAKVTTEWVYFLIPMMNLVPITLAKCKTSFVFILI